MKGIKIISPGFSTCIQDGGRFGLREYGVPVSGAMDNLSYLYANWLAFNRADEPVLEILLTGFEFKFLSSALFAITGGNMAPEKNGIPVPMWKTLRARKGDVVFFRTHRNGARAYLSINGGLRIDPELGSYSTYEKGSIGGYHGRKLSAGDIITMYPTSPFIYGRRKILPSQVPSYPEVIELGVIPGVNINYFDQEEVSKLFGTKYMVSVNSDRMGLRLEGNALKQKISGDIISYGIHPGAIQVPPDGRPIIMGPDCQTSGGYPQIANICTTDLYKLGQLKPGDSVSFVLYDHNKTIKKLEERDILIRNLFRKRDYPVCTDCKFGVS